MIRKPNSLMCQNVTVSDQVTKQPVKNQINMQYVKTKDCVSVDKYEEIITLVGSR